MKLRITCGVTGVLVALVVALAAFAWTPGADATQGQPVIAGATNLEDSGTVFCLDDTAPPVCGSHAETALVGQVPFSPPLSRGVYGIGYTGVEGLAQTDGGTGVLGRALTPTGVGVQGTQGGVGTGVYGLATNNGAGVFGDTTNGTGVQARSTNGTALNVLGKAKFSRSGIVTIPAASTSTTITLAGVTTASMVLATSQQQSGVFVKSAVPASGSFTIRLSKAAPAGGLKIAYFVLN
jgi:hypothetical protein